MSWLIGVWFVTVLLLWQIVTDRELQAWARHQCIELTDRNRPFIRHYVATGRHLRSIGMIGGFGLPLLVREALVPGAPVNLSYSWFGLFLGYLLGTLWAEINLTRPATGSIRAASLHFRELSDYLPPHLVKALPLVGPVTAAIWLSALLLQGEPIGSLDRVVTAPTAIACAITSLVTPWVTLRALRRILARPQPSMPADLLAADDAVRSRSLHELAGTAIAIDLFWAVAPLLTMGAHMRAPFGLLSPFMFLAALASFLGGVAFWRYLSHGPWQVTRHDARSEGSG